ncbi:hypothetical protein NQ314_015405 [Rhamnusium bicolor]|uniref:MADF domain-containing protein n=1 Tax=Rhamnusium bicolor TaxID=1586634 RepID=A0AAV8WYU6_9CUCU|nr:hypothetical protein NQ314_015405 [Rhamnusium bicolor]
MEMSEWNHENIIYLTNLYENKTELWDPGNKNYHLRNKKHDAWLYIAKELKHDVETIKGKMASLFSSLRREKIKMKNSARTGRKDVYVSKWFVFSSFAFLKDKDKVRETIDTESDLSVGDNIDAPTDSETEVHVSAGTESINNQTADLKEASVSNQKPEDH